MTYEEFERKYFPTEARRNEYFGDGPEQDALRRELAQNLIDEGLLPGQVKKFMFKKINKSFGHDTLRSMYAKRQALLQKAQAPAPVKSFHELSQQQQQQQQQQKLQFDTVAAASVYYSEAHSLAQQFSKTANIQNSIITELTKFVRQHANAQVRAIAELRHEVAELRHEVAALRQQVGQVLQQHNANFELIAQMRFHLERIATGVGSPARPSIEVPVSIDEVVAKAAKSTQLKEVVFTFYDHLGITDAEAMVTKCIELRDRIPVLQRITADTLAQRVRKTMEKTIDSESDDPAQD